MSNKELPEGWVETRLEEVVDILDNRRDPVNADNRQKRLEGSDERFPYYGATGQVGWIDDYLFDEELVLLGEDGAPFLEPFKNVSYTISGKTWVNNHAHVLRAKDGVITTSFLKHYLNEVDYHDFVSGTTRLKLTQGDMKEIPVWLPPFPEQRRIADRLDVIQSRIQATGDTLDQVPDRIEEYRQSVLNAAFTGRLTADWREDHPDVESAKKLLERILNERREQWEEDYRAKYEAKGKDPPSGWKSRYSEPDSFETYEELFSIPDEWTWTNLDHLAISGPQNGLYLPKSKYGSGTPILRIDDYQIGWSRSTEELQKVEAEEDDVEKYSLNVGDLVINRVNSVSHLGKCLLVEERNVPSLFESNMMRLRPTSLGSRYYLTFYLQSARGRRLLIRNAKHAVNQASINQGDVKGTPVPLPPADEQKEIVRRVRQRLEKIDEMARHVEQAGERLDRLDRSVLAKAFRGELVEAEAERAHREDRDYETAGELLNRVNGKTNPDTDTTVPRSDSEKPDRVDENGQIEMKVVDDENASL